MTAMARHKFKKGQRVFYYSWSVCNFKPHVGECTVLAFPRDYAGPVCKVELENALRVIKGEDELFATKEKATDALINHIAWHIDIWDQDIQARLKGIADRREWISKANQNIHQLTSKDTND